jgi:hypothetical protein
MKSFIVTFAKTVYRITEPLPTWFQRSPDSLPECNQCGSELVFCFAPRVDPKTAGQAGSYRNPIGIRCSCFLADGASNTLVYHQQLSRLPVPISEEKSLTC